MIVTHRAGALLDGCLAGLRPQAPTRVVVVFSTAAPVRPPPGVEAVLPGDNVGFARAANAGLRRVGAGPAVLLNDDTRPLPGFLDALAEAAARGGPGLYQPRILLDDGTGRLDNEGHNLFPDGFNLARGRGRPAGEGREAEVGAFSGAAFWMDEEVRRAVGLFDEDLDAFGEDLDLSLRARRAGYRVRLAPGAQILHALGATYGRTSPRKVFLVERNRVRAAARSLPAGAVLTMPAWTATRLAALGAAALAGRGVAAGSGAGGAAAALLGGLAGAASLPDAWRKRQRDRPHWVADDAEMWGHLWRHRARAADLLGAA